MLGALLLAIVGVPLLLLARSWVMEAEATKRVRLLIDMAVRDHSAARALLRDYPELLQARTVHEATPLHFCAIEGLAEGVRFFAKAGMPVDARDELGNTALADTVARGDLAMTKLLLHHGADPNAVSWGRGCVLHLAVQEGNPELAAALLDAGARADYVTERGETIWDAVPVGGKRSAELLRVLEGHGVRR